MNRLSTLLASISLGVAAGCATLPPVDHDFDPDTDFSALHGYAWAPSADLQLDDDRINVLALSGRIERAVSASLSSRGFSKVDRAKADFLVTYSVGLEDRVHHFDSVPERWGDDGAWDYEYKVGTLVISFTEPGTERVLWRGALQSEVDRNTPGARVESAVARILEGFPPGG